MSAAAIDSRKMWRRVLKATLGLTLVFFAVVAFAHTPWGRPLLAMLSGVPGCPAGLDGGNAGEVEATRAASVRARSGGIEVTPRALGFTLGTSTRADVLAWLGDGASRCTVLRDGQGLSCKGAALSRTGLGCDGVDVHLAFAGEVLVGLDLRRHDQAEAAMNWLGERAQTLGKELGNPARTHGMADASWLVSAPLRQVAHEYRAQRYVAQVSVTHLGPGKVSMREQYQWVAM